jgi:hypothetical protein
MHDDEQILVEIEPNVRLFKRYWGWEIRHASGLLGTIVEISYPTLNVGVLYVVTHQSTAHVGLVCDRLISFDQVVAYIRVNVGYML